MEKSTFSESTFNSSKLTSESSTQDSSNNKPLNFLELPKQSKFFNASKKYNSSNIGIQEATNEVKEQNMLSTSSGGILVDLKRTKSSYIKLSGYQDYKFTYQDLRNQNVSKDFSVFFDKNSINIAEASFGPKNGSNGKDFGEYNAIKVFAIKKDEKIYIAIPLITKNKNRTNTEPEIFPSDMLLGCINSMFSKNKELQKRMSIDAITFHTVTEENLSEIYDNMITDNTKDVPTAHFSSLIENSNIAEGSFTIFQNFHEQPYYTQPSLVNHPFYKLIKRSFPENNIFAIQAWQEKIALGVSYSVSQNPILSSVDSKLLFENSNHDYHEGNKKTLRSLNHFTDIAEKLYKKNYQPKSD